MLRDKDEKNIAKESILLAIHSSSDFLFKFVSWLFGGLVVFLLF